MIFRCSNNYNSKKPEVLDYVVYQQIHISKIYLLYNLLDSLFKFKYCLDASVWIIFKT